MRMSQRKAAQLALRQIFGVAGYRPGQKAAASCLLSGRDLLCILPTGAGKSLCWQLPAVVHEGLTVVISPLIALMQDQVARLRQRGIPAVTLNSLMNIEAQRAAERQICAGETRILFVSPERLESSGMLRLLQRMKPWLVVVDEAHCVVQWGDSFRQAYSHIGEFLGRLPVRPVVCAMTATADGAMQRRIADSLGMRRPRRVMLSVVRENLIYRLRTSVSCTQEILRMVTGRPCRTVIFCRTRARTESLAELLQQAGVSAAFYHAGLDRDARAAVQDAFTAGQLQVLTATTAFGMGIDIPDIRRVIHDSLPESITDLVQQSGRAGRDGQEAECVLLLSPQELALRSAYLAEKYRRSRWRPLERLRVAQGEWLPMKALLRLLLSGGCIQAGIAAAFGQRVRPCGRCSACGKQPARVRLPDLPRMNEDELLLWLLLWQRAALAEKRGVRPEEVISRAELQGLLQGRLSPEDEDPDIRHYFLPLVRTMAQRRAADPRSTGKK